MPKKLLLDGTFLIDLRKEFDRRKESGPATRFAQTHAARAVVSVVSVAEFLEGQTHAAESMRWLRRFGSALEITQAVALVAGALQRRLATQGRRLGENDAWQAALCLHHDLSIVSRDDRFSHVPRLRALHHAAAGAKRR